MSIHIIRYRRAAVQNALPNPAHSKLVTQLVVSRSSIRAKLHSAQAICSRRLHHSTAAGSGCSFLERDFGRKAVMTAWSRIRQSIAALGKTTDLHRA
jgi:hypothetical protein